MENLVNTFTSSLNQLLAKHLHSVYFGGNWTASCYKAQLADVTWEEATNSAVEGMKSIAILVYHAHYFVRALLGVMRGGPLDAHDKYSFDCPTFSSDEEWGAMLQTYYEEVEEVSKLISEMPHERLKEPFTSDRYGTYYDNIQGTIEHLHYHLGQIVLLKRLVRKEQK